jgi:hypothetical protein
MIAQHSMAAMPVVIRIMIITPGAMPRDNHNA